MRTVEKKKRKEEKGFSKKRDPLEATRKIEEDVFILLTFLCCFGDRISMSKKVNLPFFSSPRLSVICPHFISRTEKISSK